MPPRIVGSPAGADVPPRSAEGQPLGPRWFEEIAWGMLALLPLRSRRRSWLGCALFLLGSCAMGPDPQAVLEWPRDALEIELSLAAEPDPLVRFARIIDLTEAHPGETRALCDLLQGDEAARCQELNHRPHLRTGPALTLLPAGFPGRFAKAAATRSRPTPQALPACERTADPTGCVEQQAAREESLVAAAVCAALPELRWRSECAFRAAEIPLNDAEASTSLASRVSRAISLCAEAGPFVPQCLRHTIGAIGAQVPQSGVASAEAWAAVAEAVRALGEATEEVVPGEGETAQDYAWSVITWQSVDRASQLGGAAHAVLPPLALPHLRCALALRLVEEQDPSGRPLDELVTSLERSWNVAAPGDRPSAREYDINPGPPSLLPDQGPVGTWHHLFAGAVRAASDDPDADTKICLLEAAARRGGIPDAWAAAAEASPSAELRQTMARLGTRAFEPPLDSDRPTPPIEPRQ